MRLYGWIKTTWVGTETCPYGKKRHGKGGNNSNIFAPWHLCVQKVPDASRLSASCPKSLDQIP